MADPWGENLRDSFEANGKLYGKKSFPSNSNRSKVKEMGKTFDDLKSSLIFSNWNQNSKNS